MKKYFRMFAFVTSLVMFIFGVFFILSINTSDITHVMDKIIFYILFCIVFIVPITIGYYSLKGTKAEEVLIDKLYKFIDKLDKYI